MTKKHILFVDDEPEFLDALRDSLHITEPGWIIRFATNGHEAVQQLQEQKFDVVVSDYRMPEMDGAELLEKVQEIQPHAARLIVSGHITEEDAPRLAAPAHQCVSKPLEIDQFRDLVKRICNLRDLLGNDVLRRLVAQCSILPTIPTLYFELGKEIQDPNYSMEKVVDLISKDPAVASKILQMVNSSFFGLRRRIDSLSEAIHFVGIQIIRALALTIPVYSRFDGIRVRDYSPSAIWEHCWRTGVLARTVAQEEKQPPSLAEEAFLAGLLHDLGKMIFIANLPSLCREVTNISKKNQIPTHVAEKEVLGCTHAMVAAYLLSLWGLPQPIVEAVAFHNTPMESAGSAFNSLTAVHVANALDHACSEGKPEQFKDLVDLEYIMSLGLPARIDPWHQAGIAAFQRTRQAS